MNSKRSSKTNKSLKPGSKSIQTLTKKVKKAKKLPKAIRRSFSTNAPGISSLGSDESLGWGKTKADTAPDLHDLERIEAFKQSFLQKEMSLMNDPWRQTAFTKTHADESAASTTKSTYESPKVELQSTPFEPLHQLVHGTQRLTRKQTRELLEFGSTSNIVNDLIKKVPAQYSTCRGCGIGLQCESEHSPGYIPAPNLQSYLLRLDIQLRAAKQDLRIRSGGGKGQGTAVAALHASLKSSLGQLQRESDARTGKVGRFSEEHLNKMGLDKNLRPLAVDPIMDPETGVLVYPEHPEDNPILMDLDHLGAGEVKAMKRELTRMLNDPDTRPGAINQLQQRISDLEQSKPSLAKEAKKIRKEDILDKRDIELLTRAAKMAARPAKCQRCHRIGSKQYSAADANVGQSVPAEDFVKLLKNEFQGEDAKPSIIVQVIDVLDFHGSIIRDLPKLTGPRNPIILAVNKCDILPREVSPLQVKMWAKREAEKYGMHVHSVFPISAGTGAGVDELIEKALILARGNNDPTAPKNRNIYVMGTTNVGKSSLINQLLQKGVCGTGMPNDVTHIKAKNRAKTSGEKELDEDGGGLGEDDGFEAYELDPNDAHFMDTQPLDAEMEQEMISAKKAQRAAKKANKDTIPTDPNFNDSMSIAQVLMTSKRDRDAPDVNPVIADIDVAGINRNALNAVLPDQYLLQHQREIQLKEAISTTSPIPGTTLGIVSFPILEKKRGGKSLQIKDTPGVLNSWQLTSHLNYPELKRVLPTKKITPLTYRIQPGQSIFLGAMARVDMIAGKPFHITNFVSNAISVHIAAAHRADEDYLRSQIGVNLIPPFDPEGSVDPTISPTSLDKTRAKQQLNPNQHLTQSRVEQLNIFSNLSNASPEESQALEALQHLSRLESQLSNERSKERIHTQYVKNKKINATPFNTQDIDQDGDEISADAKAFDKKRAYGSKNVIENIPDPSNGLDELAHRRKALRDQISVALGKLAPVVTPQTSNPSRVFIDKEGRIVIQLVGEGFNTSSHDVVIAGLGWITVTGSGPCTLRISVAGEKAQLKDWEMGALEEYHHYREDSSEIIMESNVEPHLEGMKKRRGPELPTRVRKLLSRVIVRDPLVASLGRQGDKWTGLPELVKKSFTPAMTQHRAKIMKRNELLALHRKNPQLHPHPDELEQSRIYAHPDEQEFQHDMQHPFAGDDNYENFKQNDLLNRNPLAHSAKLRALQDFEQELLNEREDRNADVTKKHKVSNPYGNFDDFSDDFEKEDGGPSEGDDLIAPSHFDKTVDFLSASGQRPKSDTQKGQFDAVPHPPVKTHTEADIKLQKAKLEHKMEEKAFLDEWSIIQEFRQKHLLDQSAEALGVDISKDENIGKDSAAGAAKGFVDNLKQDGNQELAQLKEELRSQQPTREKMNEILNKRALQKSNLDDKLDPSTAKSLKKKNYNSSEEDFSEDFGDSYDGSELDSYEISQDDDNHHSEDHHPSKSTTKKPTPAVSAKKASKSHEPSSDDGEYGDDDDEELMDMDQIYEGMTTDSDDFDSSGNYIKDKRFKNLEKFDDESEGNGKKSMSKRRQRIEDSERGEDIYDSETYDEISSDFDDDGESGPELTDDVELLTRIEDMPTLEEMAEVSDFENVDYNVLRSKGLLDQYLAKENEKIQKRPVPTGPQGKRETGGRRAREAMGMISQNKFADVKQAQLAKEAKLLYSYIKKANRAAQFEEERNNPATPTPQNPGRGNRGIVPKGAPNSSTSGKQWDNQSWKFEDQNRAKMERKAANEHRNTKYGPGSDQEDYEDGPSDYEDSSRGAKRQPQQSKFFASPRAGDNGGRDSGPAFPGGDVSYDFEDQSAGGKKSQRSSLPSPEEMLGDEIYGGAPQQRQKQQRQNRAGGDRGGFGGNTRRSNAYDDVGSDEGYETDGDEMPTQPKRGGGGGGGGGFGGPRRDFDGPKRDFGGPRRDFDGPKRDFGGPKRDFDGPKRDFGGPKRDFDGPKRDFGGPRRDFDGPKRDFGGPKRDFDRGPRRDFDGPKRDFGGPKRDFDGPKRDFGGPKRDFDRGPRRDFDGPKRDFDRGPRRDFDGPKRDFDRGPKRDFGGPKRDFGGGNKFGGNGGGGRRGYHSAALNQYFQFGTDGLQM